MRVAVSLIAVAILAVLVWASAHFERDGPAAVAVTRPEVAVPREQNRELPVGISVEIVPNTTIDPGVRHVISLKNEQLSERVRASYIPASKDLDKKFRRSTPPGSYRNAPESAESASSNRVAPASDAPEGGLLETFESIDFDATGVFPADPIGAVGPAHLVNVVNRDYRIHDKTSGAIVGSGTLLQLFAGASQAPPFDPKIVYDPYESRFVIAALEVRSSPLVSRIHVAVSDDDDPTGTWYLTSIDSVVTINSTDSFSDYTGLGIDEEAVYATANQFSSTTGAYLEPRIWVIAKGAGSGGLYDGGAATTKLVAPPGNPGVNFTLQPADVFGTPPPGDTGTYFTTYNGITDGDGIEYLQVWTLENPVGAGVATLIQEFVPIGDIEDFRTGETAAPQPAPLVGLDNVGSRIYDAVWQNDNLFVTTIIQPPATDPEAGEATVYWVGMDTSSGPTTAIDQGRVGGEDIAPGTHTLFPSVSVAASGTVGIGFAAVGDLVFAGSYYTFREPTDAAGTVRPTRLVRRGTGVNQVLDSVGRNRWGDYSGIGVDPGPGSQCFWSYNMYAANPSPLAPPGKWATAWGRFCPDLSECGNSTVEPGESCDQTAGCRSNCTSCGDGRINVTETCDPPGGDCRADCSRCGDLLVQPSAGEQCDDGNSVDGDGCDAQCMFEYCGNDLLQAGEACDPPHSSAGQPDECRNDCTRCGDGDLHGSSIELLANGDFDAGGFPGWQIDHAGSGTFRLSLQGNPSPFSGRAIDSNPLGGPVIAVSDGTAPGTHALSRTFTVPADSTAAVLTFQMLVNNWAGAAVVDPAGLDHAIPAANQHARVDLLDPGFGPFDTGPGAVVANYYLGSDPAAPNGWSDYTIDITSDVVPGQSYVLRFAETGNRNVMNQGVDNVSILATVPSAAEHCDDGNNVGGDSCSSDCVPCTTAPFLQTVIALADKETFRWGSPVDLFYAVGDLDQLSSYAPTATGSIPHATQIQLTQIPDSGKGIYYVARIHCPNASWSSLGSGQCCTRTLP